MKNWRHQNYIDYYIDSSTRIDLLNSNADPKRIDGAFDENLLFLIATNDNWCQQQLTACTVRNKHNDFMYPTI